MNVLIKFSGEFFTEKDDLTDHGYKFLQQLSENNISSGYIIVGGGNRIRGKNSLLNRNYADQLGVLSTIMNSIVLQDSLDKINMKSVIYSHFNDFGKKYFPKFAKKDFGNNKWVILSSGLGSVGYVSTDLSAVIKSLELDVDAMIKITKVDGVYDKDPFTDINSNFRPSIEYDEIFDNRLGILDLSAVAIAAENNLSIGVTSIDNFTDFLNGDNCGSIIGKDWRKII